MNQSVDNCGWVLTADPLTRDLLKRMSGYFFQKSALCTCPHWQFLTKFLSFHYSSSTRDGMGSLKKWKCLRKFESGWFQTRECQKSSADRYGKSSVCIRFGNLKGIEFKCSTVSPRKSIAHIRFYYKPCESWLEFFNLNNCVRLDIR